MLRKPVNVKTLLKKPFFKTSNFKGLFHDHYFTTYTFYAPLFQSLQERVYLSTFKAV